MDKGAPIRVAFVDDHQILVEGLATIYGEKPDLYVVGTGNCVADAVRIVKEEQPDVIVLDLLMPGDIFAGIDDLIRRFPTTKIVMFTGSTMLSSAIELIKKGISAYVLKGGSSSELHEAIRMAHSGETYVTPGFASKLIISTKFVGVHRVSGVASVKLPSPRDDRP